MPSPDLMALMGGGGAPGGAAPDAGAPVSAPMATPQQNEGQQMAAMTDISMAMDLLEKSLATFGSETEQGKSILSSLSGLSRTFGEKRQKGKELVPAELMQLMSSLPQGAGASPEMKSMMGGGQPQQPMPMAA